jgi:hypothetical protein
VPARAVLALSLALALLGVAIAPAAAQQRKAPPFPQLPQAIPAPDYEGKQVLRYRFGPVKIIPGANSIAIEVTDLKPKVPGYITRFEPNLTRKDGSVPPVDELHLHHGVWLMRGYPTFAAGEEKTIIQLPKGYGYRYDPSDQWAINHMIHNLLPNEDEAYMTYEIDFVPMTAPGAAQIKEAKPLWLDVAGVSAYPVFDVKRAWGGKDGKYTFPDDVRTDAERAKIGRAQRYRARRPMTLVGTGGHLHPGGLTTDMYLRRGGEKRTIFTSEAKYWEPAGAVSWDVAMTVSPDDWRIDVQPGDQISISATYDTSKASWYESMGIMFTWYADGAEHGGGKDPFREAVRTTGRITHGRLPENDNHGGQPLAGVPDARRLLAGAQTTTVGIRDFLYTRGDLSLTGRAGRPPVVEQGKALTYRNFDSKELPRYVFGDMRNKAIYHTITACKEPCNRRTGIAYPLANGRVDFDSGELGFGPPNFTAAANRATWSTPKNLNPGTYTFFCRVHPFMRGAFRVKKKGSLAKKRAAASR